MLNEHKGALKTWINKQQRRKKIEEQAIKIAQAEEEKRLQQEKEEKERRERKEKEVWDRKIKEDIKYLKKLQVDKIFGDAAKLLRGFWKDISVDFAVAEFKPDETYIPPSVCLHWNNVHHDHAIRSCQFVSCWPVREHDERIIGLQMTGLQELIQIDNTAKRDNQKRISESLLVALQNHEIHQETSTLLTKF